MIMIAHRGNVNGRNETRENSPDYLDEALAEGYDVEVDVWFVQDKWYFGHDNPIYLIEDIDRWCHSNTWMHCKNGAALYQLGETWPITAHYFWHQTDDYALTSLGYIWTYPGKPVPIDGICVMPHETYGLGAVGGVCSDNIQYWSEKYGSRK